MSCQLNSLPRRRATPNGEDILCAASLNVSQFHSPFARRLPDFPDCTHQVTEKGIIVSLDKAHDYEYLRANMPALALNLIYKLDDPDSSKHIKQPSWLSGKDREFAGYALAAPVRMQGDKASLKALNYLAAVEYALAEIIGGHPIGIGWTANPLYAPHTNLLRSEPYSLKELADGLDLRWHRAAKATTTQASAIGYGRNDTLFHTLRKWAYASFLSGEYSFKEYFSNAVLRAAMERNEFTPSLLTEEVEVIAGSVADWVWSRYRPITSQESRGRDGNGKTRHLTYANGLLESDFALPEPLTAEEKRRRQQQSAFRTHAQRRESTGSKLNTAYAAMVKALIPVSSRTLAAKTGVSHPTASRWLRNNR